MLISGDIVLELVGFKEIFQLIHVALVKPVHLLLGGMWCLLHLNGVPHCKTKKVRGGSELEPLNAQGPWCSHYNGHLRR